MSFQENLIRARKARGMTQEELAARLNVSRQAVSKWETGTADPSTSNLLALAKLFGVPAGELLQAVADGASETGDSEEGASCGP